MPLIFDAERVVTGDFCRFRERPQPYCLAVGAEGGKFCWGDGDDGAGAGFAEEGRIRRRRFPGRVMVAPSEEKRRVPRSEDSARDDSLMVWLANAAKQDFGYGLRLGRRR